MIDQDKFDFSYSAPTEMERREIESIKNQYSIALKKENKLEQLRRLNKKVTQPPMIVGLTTGIVGTLVLGVGMTMVMEWNMTVCGVIVGIMGMAIAAAAYPIYKVMINRNKRKYGRQIIDLSNELLNSKEKVN